MFRSSATCGRQSSKAGPRAFPFSFLRAPSALAFVKRSADSEERTVALVTRSACRRADFAGSAQLVRARCARRALSSPNCTHWPGHPRMDRQSSASALRVSAARAGYTQPVRYFEWKRFDEFARTCCRGTIRRHSLVRAVNIKRTGVCAVDP